MDEKLRNIFFIPMEIHLKHSKRQLTELHIYKICHQLDKLFRLIVISIIKKLKISLQNFFFFI